MSQATLGVGIRRGVCWLGIVLMWLGVFTPPSMACPPCVNQGDCECCTLKYRVLYGPNNCPATSGEPSDDSGKADKEVPIVSDPFLVDEDNNGQTDAYHIRLTWGMTSDKTKSESLIRCFRRDKALGPQGVYTPTKEGVTATGHYDGGAGAPYVKSEEGHIVVTGSVTDPNGNLILDGDGTSGESGGTSWERFVEDGRVSQVDETRGAAIIRRTYFVYWDGGQDYPVHKRVTVEEYDSDGTKRFLTTLYRYHAQTGQLKLIVRPEGVSRFLAAKGYANGINPSLPGAACPLDNPEAEGMGDSDLEPYASSVCSVYAQIGGEYKVTEVKTWGGGGCCDAGGDGLYKFSYGDRADQQDPWNDWKAWRRVVAPNGLRIVEFTNKYGYMVYKVVQEMGGQDGKAVAAVWITRYTYYGAGSGSSAGRLNEHAFPSAYKGLDIAALRTAGCTEQDGEGYEWVKNVPTHNSTDGLVKKFVYVDGGGIAYEQIRQGTAGSVWNVRQNTYTPHTYNGVTRYFLDDESVYPGEGGTGGYVVRSRAYTFYQEKEVLPGSQSETQTNIVKFVTVTHVTITGAYNGSGSATTATYHYRFVPATGATDSLYYVDWTKHEDGTYSYTELGTDFCDFGQVVKTIVDVDDEGEFSGDPPWDIPASGHLNLTTARQYYDDTFEAEPPSSDVFANYGQLKNVTYPDGRRAAYAYKSRKKVDAGTGRETTVALVTLTAPHMQSGGDEDGHYDYAPLEIAVADLAGRTLIAATVDSTDDTDGNLIDDLSASWYAADGSIEEGLTGDTCSQTIRNYDAYGRGQLTSVDRYRTIPATGNGTEGTNYYRTSYTTNPNTGQQYKVKTPDGTIAWTVFDKLGRAAATWIGTNDAFDTQDEDPEDPSGDGAEDNNMKQVGASFYDQATAGTGASGVGDGNLTESRAVYGDGEEDYYKTIYLFDWQDRLVQTRAHNGLTTKETLDNIGRTTEIVTYRDAAGGTAWAPNNGEYYAKALRYYDRLDRVYREYIYPIYNGTPGQATTTYYWYDERGRPVKSKANRQFRKTAYDGAGRPIATYVSFDTDETTYADAKTVAGDTVVEQTALIYNKAGRVVTTTRFERKDGDTQTEGALTTSNAFYTVGVRWYDKVGRTTHVIDFGRDNGQPRYVYDANGSLIDTDSDGIPDEADPSTREPREPNDSDDYIVAKSEYNAAGRLYKATDNLDKVAQRTFDALGRVTKVEEDKDGLCHTTEYAFDAAGRLSTITAKNPNPGTGDQVTTYAYGTALGMGAQEPDVFRNDLLRAEIYPDSDDPADLSNDGNDTAYDRVEYTYDRLGRLKTVKDQREVTHTYTYTFGASGTFEVADAVSGTAGDHLDLTVRKIVALRDPFGRLSKVTSEAGDESALNEVALTYDGWNHVAESKQDHAGAAGAGDPAVAYTYEYSSGNYVRLDKVTYPGASREVYYNYLNESNGSSGIDDVLSRVRNIADGDETPSQQLQATQYARYAYLGGAAVIQVVHPAVTGGLALTLDPAGDHTYGGLDRFGRVVDQRWQTDAPVLRDQFCYGYDKASNRLWRDVGPDMPTPPTGKDELYTYDGLHRLADARRGTLNEDKDGLTTTGFRQNWALDHLGNWPGFNEDAGPGGEGQWDLEQTRTHNTANELTGITGGSWVVPDHDLAGNMTRAPRPGDEATAAEGLFCVYDAWNRLVAVWKDDGDGTLETTGTPPDDTLLAKYQYDGLRRRIAKLLPNETNWNRTDYYYSGSWQCLEERSETVAGETTPADDVKVQYVWDLRYIDAPVLRWRDTGGDPDLDETLYFCQDANMNVTALVDGTTGSGTFGEVVERVQYDPYGKPKFYDGTWQNPSDDSAYSSEILFAGYRYDSETGLYHVRYRSYHPTLGRWLQRDPIGHVDGMSLYEYVGGGPGSAADPFALMETPIPPELKKVFDDMGADPEQGDDSRIHGTLACLPKDCCDDLKAKLAKWILHAAQRSYELFQDKYDFKHSNPTRWNNHVEQLNTAISHITRCFELAGPACKDEGKPPPPFPGPIPMHSPVQVPAPAFPPPGIGPEPSLKSLPVVLDLVIIFRLAKEIGQVVLPALDRALAPMFIVIPYGAAPETYMPEGGGAFSEDWGPA